MATRQRDPSAQAGEKPRAREKRFRLFGGLRDRLNKSTPRKVIKSITAAMHDTPGRSEERIRDAGERFAQLSLQEQDEVLGEVETLLESASANCGQSELITNQAYNLAHFLSLASKSMESFEDMETIHEHLAMAATSHQAEYTSDIFREMRSMAVIALYECGGRSEKTWEELLMHSGSRGTAVNVLLEAGESEPGWALLRKKLSLVNDSVISSPSQKRDAFILASINGDDVQAACVALQMAASLNERTAFYKAAEQLSLSDAVPDELWVSARNFLDISDLLAEVEDGGERQVEAVGKLCGMVMGGLEYLRPILERTYKDMESLAESGDASQKLRSVMSLSILASIGIGKRGNDAEVQGLVNSLLGQWDEEGIEALKSDSPRLIMPIALSNSPNKWEFVSMLLSDENPLIVRAGFNISVNFIDTTKARERADAIIAGEDDGLKQYAVDFLETIALIDELEMADERQFTAAHRLIDKYLSNLSLIGTMLLIRDEMEGMIIEAAQDARESGTQADVSKQFDILNRLMSIGIMPQKINIRYDMSA